MMQLNGVLFLAAYTSRSQTYAQAMAAKGLRPAGALLFGDAAAQHPQELGFPLPGGIPANIFLPNLKFPLRTTCDQAGWPVTAVESANINDIKVHDAVRDLKPRLIIYSGYGGQIIKKDLLDLGTPFLHFHAGWLPDERGSTTIYYSLLMNGDCSVTALLLDKQIDTGAILARRRYSRPPPRLNVDHYYDSAIRADLLVDILIGLHKEGRLPVPIPQEPRQGTTYYVIHPVLKHITLLSLEEDS